ncbi:MAG: hypothetical protein ACI9M3_001510 [Bacteroidia bacterium]|jgi:hypothetical protein
MNMTKLTYILGTLLLLLLSFTAYSASPIITLKGTSDTTIDVFSTYQDSGATAYDAEDGDISSSITVTGTINTSLIGDYVLFFEITDTDGNNNNIVRIVRVRDREKPIITYLGTDSAYFEVNRKFTSPGVTVTDNYDVNISSSVQYFTNIDSTITGYYYEEFWATDSSGNTSDTLHITLLVVSDLTPPVLTLIGALDTIINVDSIWAEPGATALDAKEGNMTNAIVISGTVDTKILGSYIVQYDVRDNQGNATNATRTVHIVDTILPKIENANADKTDSCWIVEVVLQNIFVDITTATDNYNSLGNGLTLVANPASPQGGADVDTRFQGTTSVTYTATDSSGNVTTQCINYVVRDYFTPAGFQRELDTITHRVNTPWISTMRFIDSIDGDITSSILIDSKVNIYTLGEYDVNYAVTNSRGKTFTKTTVVQIIDDQNPIITGKNDGVVKILINSTYDPSDYINLSDNYDAPSSLLGSLVILYNDVDVSTVGLYRTVFQATDLSGNSSNEYTLYTEVKQTLSINKLARDEKLTIYPNPSSGGVSIQSMHHKIVSISLVNCLGQHVYSQHFNSKEVQFNLSYLPSGIYILEIASDSLLTQKRLIIN